MCTSPEGNHKYRHRRVRRNERERKKNQFLIHCYASDRKRRRRRRGRKTCLCALRLMMCLRWVNDSPRFQFDWEKDQMECFLFVETSLAWTCDLPSACCLRWWVQRASETRPPIRVFIQVRHVTSRADRVTTVAMCMYVWVTLSVRESILRWHLNRTSNDAYHNCSTILITSLVFPHLPVSLLLLLLLLLLKIRRTRRFVTNSVDVRC